MLTAIVYLNDADWAESDGGCLRCFVGADKQDNDGKTGRVENVLPVGGRLVLFRSRDLLHSVTPVLSARRRYAMSCWLLKPELEKKRRASQRKEQSVSATDMHI